MAANAADDLSRHMRVLFHQIPSKVTMRSIKAAYRAQSLRWHPDRGPLDEQEARLEKMKLINAAYEALKDAYEQGAQGVHTRSCTYTCH
jgi:hypothetical protein